MAVVKALVFCKLYGQTSPFGFDKQYPLLVNLAFEYLTVALLSFSFPPASYRVNMISCSSWNRIHIVVDYFVSNVIDIVFCKFLIDDILKMIDLARYLLPKFSFAVSRKPGSGAGKFRNRHSLYVI